MTKSWAGEKSDFPIKKIMGLLRTYGIGSKSQEGHQQILVSIGATRYTSYSERTFLKPDDIAFIALFDQRYHSEDSIKRAAIEDIYFFQTSPY